MTSTINANDSNRIIVIPIRNSSKKTNMLCFYFSFDPMILGANICGFVFFIFVITMNDFSFYFAWVIL